MTAFPAAIDCFRTDYAAHRATEGRGYAGDDLLRLPYITHGPLARQWAVRARTFDAFAARLVWPLARDAGRPLAIGDLGAGNGWLSYRLALAGHACTAIDLRDDEVDGLGAAAALRERAPFACVTAAFDVVPLPDATFDLTVFNAALHYATDLAAALVEAARLTRPGGTIAILDSPCYVRDADGAAMVAEKHATAHQRFGERAPALLGLPFIEFLTADRLARAGAPLGLAWRRRRVRYPVWYELRPLIAKLRRRRPPSRFDFWTAARP